jgi:hypothetical protein
MSELISQVSSVSPHALPSAPPYKVYGGAQPAPSDIGYGCNAGGPMSRRREQAIRASVLGTGRDGLRLPRVLGAAIDFGSSDPVPFVQRLLGRCGFENAEEACHELLPRIGPSICRESVSVKALSVRAAPPEAILRVALILGHATPFFFDPARPLIWTRSSLKRRLQLFNPRRFYEA